MRYRVTVNVVVHEIVTVILDAENEIDARAAGLEKSMDMEALDRIDTKDRSVIEVEKLEPDDEDNDQDVLDEDNFEGNDDHIGALKDRVRELRQELAEFQMKSQP
jgi:hypothetical protein